MCCVYLQGSMKGTLLVVFQALLWPVVSASGMTDIHYTFLLDDSKMKLETANQCFILDINYT